MAEAESFHARKPGRQEPVVVSMTEEDASQNSYDINPFVEESRQNRPRSYNVSIPTVEHWPEIIAASLKSLTNHTLHVLHILKSKHESYQSLPSSSSYSSSSFGKRKRRDAGKTTLLGRQLSRILIFLALVAIVLIWIVLPSTIKPFQNRAIWIRYYNHEEPIKIKVPYSLQVDVYDVKKEAMKELFMGYGGTAPNEARLISRYGRLDQDDKWKLDHYWFENDYYSPIIAVPLQYELFLFLNGTLGCFSGMDKFDYKYEDIRFRSFDFQRLYRVLHMLRAGDHDSSLHMFNNDIHFLREAFNDPKQNEYPSRDSTGIWTRPEKPRRPHWMEPIYDYPMDREWFPTTTGFYTGPPPSPPPPPPPPRIYHDDHL